MRHKRSRVDKNRFRSLLIIAILAILFQIAFLATFVPAQRTLECDGDQHVVTGNNGTPYAVCVDNDPPKVPEYKLEPVPQWIPHCNPGYEVWRKEFCSSSTLGWSLGYNYGGFESHKVEMPPPAGDKPDNYECRKAGYKPKHCPDPMTVNAVEATKGYGDR